MAKLPEQLRGLLVNGHDVWVRPSAATACPTSRSRAAAPCSTMSTSTSPTCSRKTRANLEHNRHVAVGIHDAERQIAVQVKGSAELIEEGTLFERVVARLHDLNAQFPPVKYVVKINVESVWDMSPGPHAGEKIE